MSEENKKHLRELGYRFDDCVLDRRNWHLIFRWRGGSWRLPVHRHMVGTETLMPRVRLGRKWRLIPPGWFNSILEAKAQSSAELARGLA